ncbi:MAG: hypothetical protein OEN56_03265 [Gemmatimonadota bacterium]|nr:hypothetical protein [Gemmatimonadota bacterium]MDH3424101.1 hypothetical protein [Gemmatimonadota bacterium]
MHVTRKGVLALTTLSLPLLLALACASPRATKTDANFDRRECPHDPTWAERDPASTTQFSPDRLAIPELHDCQRFIEEEGYTSLFAVFMGEQAYDTETFVALIVSEEGGSYDPLGLRPPSGYPEETRFFQCLLVEPNPQAGSPLVARLVSIQNEHECSATLPRGPNDFVNLDVRVPSYSSEYEERDFPQVARWAYHDRVQYVTMWCGPRRWCDVGPRGFTPAPVSDTGDRTRDIVGWHDQQILAVVDGDSLVPSGVMGTIYPAPDLGRYSAADFAGRWLFVAEVSLTGALPAYAAEFNFVPATADRLSRIELCQGDEATCVGTEGVADKSACVGPPTWWARLSRPGSAPEADKYKCITRHFVSNPVADPGTVRWRWRVLDEGGWMRCPQGCCELL